MALGMILAAGASIIGGLISSNSAAKNRELAESQYADQKANRETQQEALKVQKEEYKRMQFQNPFANMENVYEDLTVNQQQAQFQSQQGAQQRANIMQGLKGAAGSSGIAGLAQSMANQGALQTQRISASIGLQESQNQIAAAKGASAVQIAQRQGDQYVQQANMDRQATLLGMQMGQTTGANLAASQAQANQMNAALSQQQVTANMMGNITKTLAQSDFSELNLKKPKTAGTVKTEE